ncbi:oxidoreductase [Salmonella enterica subsp. salamae]|nr:oxidoreductase [Salmonella enterica subsp. salamae]
MDVASTLKILGCPSVTCVAREELAEFPASEKEFTSTQALGVSIIDGFTPVAVNGNKVTFHHVRHSGRTDAGSGKYYSGRGTARATEYFCGDKSAA